MDAKQVPLRELLASVPADARLVIDDADGKGTRFIPVGRLCQEAAAALAERDNYAESASLLAQAVVLAEREKCAQLVETYEKAGNTMNAPEYVMVFKDCAAAIRARGRQ